MSLEDTLEELTGDRRNDMKKEKKGFLLLEVPMSIIEALKESWKPGHTPISCVRVEFATYGKEKTKDDGYFVTEPFCDVIDFKASATNPEVRIRFSKRT